MADLGSTGVPQADSDTPEPRRPAFGDDGIVYLIPNNLRGVRGPIIEWLVCRLGSLALLAIALVTALVWKPQHLVGTVIVVVSVAGWSYLWITAFVVSAWSRGTRYSRFLWGVSDSQSGPDGRIRLDDLDSCTDEELAAYEWSFRRNIRAGFRPLAWNRQT